MEEHVQLLVTDPRRLSGMTRESGVGKLASRCGRTVQGGKNPPTGQSGGFDTQRTVFCRENQTVSFG